MDTALPPPFDFIDAADTPAAVLDGVRAQHKSLRMGTYIVTDRSSIILRSVVA